LRPTGRRQGAPAHRLSEAIHISGDLAELYGHVNRSLPDSELETFVDALAMRIAWIAATVPFAIAGGDDEASPIFGVKIPRDIVSGR
jgi:hypothetical protein